MTTTTDTANTANCISAAMPDETNSSELLTSREYGDHQLEALTMAGLPNKPESDKEADAVDQILAEELKKLTFEEQERVAFDVHGMVNDAPDPDNIDDLLEQLEREICALPEDSKKAYEQAKYLNQDYVTNRKFRLMFLRLDEYGVKMTAHRIVAHFQAKQELFGSGAILARDIRQSDLSSKDDLKALQCGNFQLLPVRDAAGRVILFHSAVLRDESILDLSMMRCIFYTLYLLNCMEDVQRNGMVVVSWWSDGLSPGLNLVNFYHNYMKKYRVGMPRKATGVHLCATAEYLRPLISGMRWFLRPDMRARMCAHFGNVQQLIFDLQTYGIPTDCLPIEKDSGGRPHRENHHQWLVSQRKREEQGEDSNRHDIIVPRRFDVLFGRGYQAQNHTGNMRAAHIADMFRDKYEAAGKTAKTQIAERIVALIRESHGRFLKFEDDAWFEVDAQTARNKISHFFRNTRKRSTSKGSAAPSGGGGLSDSSVSGESTSTDSDDTRRRKSISSSASSASSKRRSQPENLIQAEPLQKRAQTVM